MPACYLEAWIRSKSIEVVAIRIAKRNRIDSLLEEQLVLMQDTVLVSLIKQMVSKAASESDASIKLAKQHRATIRTLPLIIEANGHLLLQDTLGK